MGSGEGRTPDEAAAGYPTRRRSQRGSPAGEHRPTSQAEPHSAEQRDDVGQRPQVEKGRFTSEKKKDKQPFNVALDEVEPHRRAPKIKTKARKPSNPKAKQRVQEDSPPFKIANAAEWDGAEERRAPKDETPMRASSKEQTIEEGAADATLTSCSMVQAKRGIEKGETSAFIGVESLKSSAGAKLNVVSGRCTLAYPNG